MLLYSHQSADESESDLLFSEASSTEEAGEECFVLLLVYREQPKCTKMSVITVNLCKGLMAAKQPVKPTSWLGFNNGSKTSKSEGERNGQFPSPKSTRTEQKVNMSHIHINVSNCRKSL